MTSNETTLKRTFRWRDAAYRIDRSTWQFRGDAYFVELPNLDKELRMTPNATLFIALGVRAGFDPDQDLVPAEQAPACRQFLETKGYRVWAAAEALALVQSDPETELAARLLDALVYHFFIVKF